MVIKYAEKARWIGSRSSSTSGSRRTANAASATDGPFGFANTKAKALRDRDEVCQNGFMSLRAIRTLCAHPPGSTNATLRAQREPRRATIGAHAPQLVREVRAYEPRLALDAELRVAGDMRGKISGA